MTEILRETSHVSGPLHYAGESHFQFPQNWGKYSATNIGQIAILPSILELQKHSCDCCVINNLVCRRFDLEQQSMLSLKWIRQSNFLCKVYQSPCWCSSLWDLTITRVCGSVYTQRVVFFVFQITFCGLRISIIISLACIIHSDPHMHCLALHTFVCFAKMKHLGHLQIFLDFLLTLKISMNHPHE